MRSMHVLGCPRLFRLTLPLAAVLCCLQAVWAADPAHESERLAAIKRQLQLAGRLAEHAAASAPTERLRYHFDYARLHHDIERIRAGLNDYLTPQRAQPRDPVELLGDYRQPDRRSDEVGTQ